jgi:hypothetical protein
MFKEEHGRKPEAVRIQVDCRTLGRLSFLNVQFLAKPALALYAFTRRILAQPPVCCQSSENVVF